MLFCPGPRILLIEFILTLIRYGMGGGGGGGGGAGASSPFQLTKLMII